MRSRGIRRAATCAALVAVLLTGTACQDSAATSGDADQTGPSPSSPSSTTSTESPVPTPSPSRSVNPSVEPADGVLIDVPGATIRGLKGYRHIADYGIVQAFGDGQSYVLLTPHLTGASSLDAFAKEFARDQVGPRFAKRLEDDVVAGTYSAWVIVNSSDPRTYTRTYGVMYLDGAWVIEFSFPKQAFPRPLTLRQREKVIDRILATFEVHPEDGQAG